MDYVYFHFRKDSTADAWSTAEIERFLHGTGLFPPDSLTSQRPFLSISLMNVQRDSGWNTDDYDPVRTNYIATVTSDRWYWGIRKDAEIQAVFDGLEQLLHTKIQEDW